MFLKSPKMISKINSSNDVVHDDHVPIVPEIESVPVQPEAESSPNVIVVTPSEMLKCPGCTFETIDPVSFKGLPQGLG